jgi:hypothetical protein
MIYLAIFTIVGFLIGRFESRNLFKLQKRTERIANIKNFHLHHDLVGILLILISLVIRPFWLGASISGVGFGLFIHHLTTEGLKLITKK